MPSVALRQRLQCRPVQAPRAEELVNEDLFHRPFWILHGTNVWMLCAHGPAPASLAWANSAPRPPGAIDADRDRVCLTMQRLIEQPAGDGDVFAGPVRAGRVHYHLSVYQHFSDAEGESVPAHIEVEGRITPVNHTDLIEMHQERTELTLRLTDGRVLDFLIANEEGTIRSTGRGLHQP